MSTTLPNLPGCWANSATAVTTCCSQFGGVQEPLPGSSTPACGYNAGSSFIADGDEGSSNTTSARWASCIAAHFDVATDGKQVLTTCVNSQNQTATVTSAPSSSASGTSSAVSTIRGSRFGPVVLAGIVATSALIHVLSLAI